MDKRVRIKVDDTGVGGGVTDILESEGYNVIPINFQSIASDKDKYPSIISEMWYEVAEQIDNISCPEIERLQLELTNRKGNLDSKGRRVVESKDDYKKRRNASPDLADAFLLCFYKSNEQPVKITQDTIIMSDSYEIARSDIFQTA